MSKFFVEDTCSFNADPAITGTVERTWSDIDSPFENSDKCYIHKDLPLRVRKAWFEDEKLTPGYVILAFRENHDGLCLVAEDALRLVDRSLAAGHLVKKRLLDTQSGTVMNTSMMCSLQPLCSQSHYYRKQYPPIQGHTPTHGPHAPNYAGEELTALGPELIHGFPALTSPAENRLQLCNTTASCPTQAPASELKFWNSYREEDTLIYMGWVGEVRSVYDEVTVRLANGSVVTVEKPENLETPYWILGTPSYELAQRLDRAGYYHNHHCHKKDGSCVGKPHLTPAEPCYPGQYVQTKKWNLRRGRWKYGAYDPNVTPGGIVVGVRNVQIEVRWLSPIIFQGNTPLQPSTLLNTDVLESGKIVVYDRNRLPKHPATSTLANASYSPDVGFGHRVRFKDPSGAAIKYGPTPEGAPPRPTPILDQVPRTATQGFDMNVFQVVATTTKVTVRWQDCTITEEDSTQLSPYLADENDVWPGDKVSFIPEEEKMGDSVPIIRLHKVGVVQSVDARERIARVRWFEGTEIEIDEDEKAFQYSASKYGKLSDEIVEVPLYDIAAHAALAMDRGDLVTVAPEQDLSLEDADDEDADDEEDFGPPEPIDPVLSAVDRLNATFHRARTMLRVPGGDPRTTASEAPSLRAKYVGEIADLCLDGEVLVRLGAAYEVLDIKVPVEQVKVVASADTGSSDLSDEDDEDGDSYFSDAMSVDEEEQNSETYQDSVRSSDMSIEYEGGEKLNDDGDDDGLWATDEEDVDGSNEQKPSVDDPLDQHMNSTNAEPVQLDGAVTAETPNASSDSSVPIAYSSYSSMPTRFSVLEDAAPSDHHFFGSSRPLTADLMRRVTKEHQIMKSSLPDGIFVRTWESRLDLLRVLIVGPFDTPYEFAPFVVDLHFGLNFPTSSPDAHFHSWTGGSGRINPNLYENGKICLSLLGTWDADERNEEWSPKRSTVLQILVSLMGLVLVQEPYYNEAGFDILIGSPDSKVPSALYSEKVYMMSKGFIKTALTDPPQGLKDIIQWLYLPSQPGPHLLRRVVDDAKRLLATNIETTSATGNVSDELTENDSTKTKLSTGASIFLQRSVDWLEDYMKRNEEGTQL